MSSFEDAGTRPAQEEQLIKFRLKNGDILSIRISLGAAPKIGTGPRPKKGELFVSFIAGDDEVLNIAGAVGPPSGGVKIGSGDRPG